MQTLDPRTIWLWRLQSLLRYPLSWLPLALLAGAGISGVAGAAPGAAAGVGVALLGLLLGLIWPAVTYQFFGYDVRAHDLLLQSGVFFRRRSAIPHSRIQHVETRQGPVERIFGLSRVLVFTASGVSADGAIPGLDSASAEALRDELARRGGDDGV